MPEFLSPGAAFANAIHQSMERDRELARQAQLDAQAAQKHDFEMKKAERMLAREEEAHALKLEDRKRELVKEEVKDLAIGDQFKPELQARAAVSGVSMPVAVPQSTVAKPEIPGIVTEMGGETPVAAIPEGSIRFAGSREQQAVKASQDQTKQRAAMLLADPKVPNVVKQFVQANPGEKIPYQLIEPPTPPAKATEIQEYEFFKKPGELPDQYQARVANLKRPVVRDDGMPSPFAKGPSAGSQVVSGPPGEVDATALEGLTPKAQNVVKAMAEYRYKLPTGRALTTPYWLELIERTHAYDPSFDETQYGARQSLQRDFSAGKSAGNIRSLNTAIGHLDTLNQAGKALGSTDFPLVNRIEQAFSSATGKPEVVKFDTAATAVESELATLFKGTGGTDQEIKEWRAQVNSAASPAQKLGFLTQAAELARSRMEALQDQYSKGMGKPLPGLLTEKSEKVLAGLSGGLNAEPKGGGMTRMTRPDGKKVDVPADQVEEARKRGWK